jgi:antirestriction protein ArdC
MPIIGMADVLRDNRAVVRAASQASKAADFLLSFIPDSVASAPSDSVVDDWEAA